MSLPATAKWVALALVGLAIAIGVAIAAAHLTSQQIGIASESVSAGDALAPSLHVPGEKPGPGGDQRASAKEGTTTLPAEPPATTTEEVLPEEEATPPREGKSDDYGGEGGGSDGDD
jgi:hypothetical protein